MLVGAKLPTSFWAEAINTSNYLRNITPTRICGETVPKELWSGWKPSVSFLKVFGCRVYAHIPKQKRKGKLDQRAYIGIMMGYANNRKAYRVWDSKKKEMLETRDVYFDESVFDGITEGDQQSSDFVEIFIPDKPRKETQSDQEDSDDDPESDVEVNLNQEDDWDTDQDIDKEEQVDSRYLLRERTDRVKPVKYTATARAGDHQDRTEEPRNYKDALKSKDADKWKLAIQNEVDSLTEKGVWKIVDRPRDRKAIGYKWIFKIKHNADGSIDKYKARLVAQGFTQRYGIDYDETYSPVSSMSSFRLLYAIAIKKGWQVEQMDVRTAYLNGKLEEDIYMEVPEGFSDHGDKNKVCHLERSIYGLKQSGRCWNTELNTRLTDCGWKRSRKDSCVYYQHSLDGMAFLIVYVDDLVLIAETSQGMEKIKDEIKARLEVTEMGELKFYLKLAARRDEEGNAYLSQKQYIKEILEKYGMQDCKPAATALDASMKLKKNVGELAIEERKIMEQVPYRQAVGSLQYLVQGTRPDIAFAVSKFGQYTENPGVQHWGALKHVLRYLKRTMNMELTISKDDLKLEAYCDSDWASCIDERKSQTGYVIMIGATPVIWKSVKQKCVSLSTQEAEFIALTECAKEVLWVSHLLAEIGLENCYQFPIKVFCDNQAAMVLASRPTLTNRSKHVDLKYHFVQDLVIGGKVTLEYIPTEENTADIFTKSLPRLRNHDMLKQLKLSQ
jgi:hypothetical protein